MTTIIAIWTPCGAAIAADRRACAGGYERRKLASPKVRRVADWLMVGIAGSGPDLLWRDTLDASDVERDPEAVAHWLGETWRARTDDMEHRGSALAITPWGIIEIDRTGTAWRYDRSEQVAAIGSGGGFATGAAAVLLDREPPQGCGAVARLAGLAVRVACRHDTGSGDGVDMMTVEVEP